MSGMSALPVDGTVLPGFEPVREAFAEVLGDQSGSGAAVAAWHDGAWVVDLWGGYADAARTRPWRRDSIVMPYSVTKPFAAVCVLVLVDRGLVHLDTPMSAYWPGFTAAATVRHVLAHASGVCLVEEPLPAEAMFDHDRVCLALERQRPLWEPGSAPGEAALVYGHLLGELVRRVDGRSLGSFLRDEVCTPYGLDFHVGLGPDELSRAVELTGFGDDFHRGWEEYGALFHHALGNPPGALDLEVVNSERWRRAEIAAVNGHGTARAVAGLYVALTREGLLSRALLEDAVRPQVSGVDRLLGQEASWGLGFGVDEEGFGMGGLGGSFGWWSERDGYAFAFLTGEIGSGEGGDAVEAAFRGALDL